MTADAPRTKPAKTSDEYDAFEKLTRKLVKVPKREVDAERAKTNGNGKKSTR